MTSAATQRANGAGGRHAVLQLLAAAGVLAGSQLARWFAVAVLELNAIDMMLLHPGLPVLGADHYRHGRGRAVQAVRLCQP